jgi:glycine/sarcosine N-methyltransferase
MKNQFDENFAQHWDELIDWDSRLKTFNFINKLLVKHQCRKILDVATGTGFDSINLIKNGYEVFSQDASAEMLTIAQRNAKNNNIDLKIICKEWGEYQSTFKGKNLDEKFDAIICLGNSLACETRKSKRAVALKEWFFLLKPSGILILDHRNYETNISKKGDQLKSIYYHGKSVKIVPDKVSNHMTRFRYLFNDGNEFGLNMYPIKLEELFDLSINANFLHIEMFADNLNIGNIPDQENINFYQHVFKKE